ncbi:HtaA domain-containing protein [Streptomyces sp. NPDC057638]|uniref:HtaA domain-containing protein n=1 Tax=Streptomyces sp. NPDC057638 TaxID=3346190 RepID=UPI0036CAEFF3
MPATRRPLTLAAAVATATALGATALALPAAAAGPAGKAAEPATGQQAPRAGASGIGLKDGTLDWGFKKEFRDYVGRGGSITVKDGAQQAAGNGPFTFTGGVGTYDPATKGTRTSFTGTVVFAAQHFTLTLTDLTMVSDRTKGSVQGDVTMVPAAGPGAGKKTEYRDIALAQLDMTRATPGQGAGGAMVFRDIPATITKKGGEIFHYPEGEKLDPVTLSVKAAGGKPTPSPTGKPTGKPTPSPTGKPTSQPSAKPSAKPTAKPSAKPTAKPTSKPTPPAGKATVVDGNLDWGVKKSFRTYVSGPIAQGKVELKGGATASGSGYRFPKGTGTYDTAKKSLSVGFGGSVRFLGHRTQGQYILDLRLSDLTVKASGTKGTLYADVSTKSKSTGAVKKYDNLALATLKLPSGALTPSGKAVTLKALSATLTADGTKAFDGMYKAGEPLDKVTAAASLDKAVKLPAKPGGSSRGGAEGGSADQTGTGGAATGGGGSVGGGTGAAAMGNLADTGAEIPAGALAAASAVVVAAGAGVVFAARRRGART